MMRGQVVTEQGIGIVGIRVSVDRDPRFGFTLTRADGWWVLIFTSYHIVSQNTAIEIIHEIHSIDWTKIIINFSSA